MATKKFKCELCGYIHEGDKAPATCPKCGASADAFTEIVEAGAEAGPVCNLTFQITGSASLLPCSSLS